MIYFWFALIPCKLQNPLRSWKIRIAFMNYFLYGELLASNTSPNPTWFLSMPLSLPKDVTKLIIFRQAHILHSHKLALTPYSFHRNLRTRTVACYCITSCVLTSVNAFPTKLEALWRQILNHTLSTGPDS